MRAVYVVLNWETEGSHGPSILLGANSSWLVREVLAGAPDARTYSVLPSLFRGLFGPQQLNRHAGVHGRGAGTQFLYLRGQTDYHTALDDIERLGRGSLQLHGGYAVGLIRELGDAALTAPPGDRPTYFKVTGGVIVQYRSAVAGATAPLRGDHPISDAALQTTGGIEIHAPPENVWSWLIHMGQRRAGLYTCEWFENLLGAKTPQRVAAPYGLTRAASSALA